ncbi:MAG: YicC/YloC family endoribonuclease [Candidatus Hatepunaea meridiana]|nr:YicC/YloC family endoribonuclease [Candidatus Hatepunaea meridiana]
MPRSMTGYGTGQAFEEGLGVTVELRSVNNRFLDINIRMPYILNPQETEIRNIIRQSMPRGRVSMFVKEESKDDKIPDIRIDLPKAIGYARELEQLRKELNLGGELKLEQILTIDNLFLSNDEAPYRERFWKLCKIALEKAIEEVIAAGKCEAETICNDLIRRITAIHEQLEIVKNAAKKQVVTYSERLTARLSEILEDNRIDHTRLETEIALAADRLDISEEIVRLESHLGMFSDTIRKDEPIGKTLGFILQEMGREANTIASKSWTLNISQAAIKIKETIEQIREQVQNIE